MTKSKFFDLPHPKQVQLFISICIHGKSCLSTTSTLVGFQKDIKQFISHAKITSLEGEALVCPSTIISNNNVQRNVKHKLDFVESK
jgi:hypothetical protein